MAQIILQPTPPVDGETQMVAPPMSRDNVLAIYGPTPTVDNKGRLISLGAGVSGGIGKLQGKVGGGFGFSLTPPAVKKAAVKKPVVKKPVAKKPVAKKAVAVKKPVVVVAKKTTVAVSTQPTAFQAGGIVGMIQNMLSQIGK